MKRPLFWCCALYIAGIYTSHFLFKPLSALLLSIAVIAAILKIIISRKLYASLLSVLLVLSFGFGMYSVSRADLPKSLEPYLNRTYLMELRVCEIPEINEDYSIFVCDVLSVTKDGKTLAVDDKIRLTYSGKSPDLSLGDIFEARCKITKPTLPENRGTFNYSLYLKTKGIFYTGQSYDTEINIVSRKNYTTFDYFKLLNARLCENIDSAFTDETAILLKAMVLGEKSDMPANYYSSFKRSGLSHIIAVSGMHLSYLVMFLFIFRKVFKINNRSFAGFAILFVLGFAMLTGMSPSVVRAGIMISCIFIGDLVIRRSDSLTSLGMAAVIIAVQNPFAVFSSSFILSFFATLGILIMAPPLETKLIPKKIYESKTILGKIAKAVMTIFCITLSAQIMTFPFSATMFGEFSFWSLPANIIIAPICPLILIGGFLFCFLSIIYTPLAFLLTKALSVAVFILNIVVNFFSSLKFGVLHIGEANFFAIFSFIMLILIFLLWLYNKKWIVTLPVVMLITTLVCYAVYTASTNSYAYVTFLNIGHGDSTHISLPNGIDVLIDGGKYSYTHGSDVDSATINTYLNKKGVKDIDLLIASHAHNDHTGGLLAVMDCFDVKGIITPINFGDSEVATELIEKANEKGIPIYSFNTGSSVDFSDEISLLALMPDDSWAQKAKELNDTSLVLRLDCYGTSFLFTGDLEAAGEEYMIESFKEEYLDVDVLKVAHHGSKTSTTEAFLNATTPKFAFIPGGENNFKVLSDEVLSRLENHTEKVFRADVHGDVTFVLTTEGINNIIYN